jgi:hypothetical protein
MFPMRTKWDTYTAYMVKGEWTIVV